MNKIAYADQTFNTPNPIARYAHRSRLRRSLAYANEVLPQGASLIDFGCGTGDFLNALKLIRPDASLIGFDPYLFGSQDSFARVTDIGKIASASLDVVCCFEVLEHLSDQDLAVFLTQGKRVLKPGGYLLVSVPIMGGLTLLLKESNRALLFRRKSDYSPMELLRATFGGIVERTTNRLGSHKGFSFQEMRYSLLKENFSLVREAMCPFAALPWWLNSQIFLLLNLA